MSEEGKTVNVHTSRRMLQTNQKRKRACMKQAVAEPTLT